MAACHRGGTKCLGAGLIVVGAIITFLAVPCWLWAALVGVTLVGIGIGICRFYS